MSDIFENAVSNGQTYHSLEVVKNTKGYNWTVKCAGVNLEDIKSKLVETEKFLNDTYGSKE